MNIPARATLKNACNWITVNVYPVVAVEAFGGLQSDNDFFPDVKQNLPEVFMHVVEIEQSSTSSSQNSVLHGHKVLSLLAHVKPLLCGIVFDTVYHAFVWSKV